MKQELFEKVGIDAKSFQKPVNRKNISSKILIVDDNETISKMIQNYLQLKSNYDCMVLNNAKNALPLILGGQYDIVLLDLTIPEYSGLDLINYLEITGQVSQSKIIVFTAASLTDNEINELIKKGVYSVVRKPVKLAELLEIIRAVSEEKHPVDSRELFHIAAPEIKLVKSS